MTQLAGPAGLHLPATRPRGRLAFLLPLPVAAALGVAIGLAPRPTLLVVAAGLVGAVLAVRLEWAACALAGAAVFADYLDVLSRWTVDGLALVLLVAWLIRRARGSVGRPGPVAPVVACATFTVVLVLATAAHPNGRPGLDVVARYGELLLVFLVLVDGLAGSVRPRRVARAYVWACAAAAVCGIVDAVVGRHPVSGPLDNPDDLAFFLVAAIPLAGALRTSRRWRSDVLIGLLAAATLGTESRGALVALVAMVVLAVLTREVSWRVAATLVVLAATAAATFVAVVPQTVGDHLTGQQRYVEARVSQRLDLWRAAASMTRDHPLLGLGPGAFALYAQDYQPAVADDGAPVADGAHSTVLQVSAELGGLGAIALVGVFLVPVAAARDRWRRRRTPMVSAVVISLVGLLVASLFETEQAALPLWLLAALATAVGRRRPGLSLTLVPPPRKRRGPQGRLDR